MLNIQVLLYVPNVVNYLRLVCMILMIFYIKHRPILTFALTLTAGFIDSIDGRLARYLNQTSHIGALFDLSLDRLLLLSILFTLAAFYRKYSTVFLTIACTEIMKDICVLMYKNEQSSMQIKYLTQLSRDNRPNPTSSTLDSVVYYGADATSSTTVRSSSLFGELSEFTASIEPYIWYASDLFYWILYFNAFLPKSEIPVLINNNNSNNNVASLKSGYFSKSKWGGFLLNSLVTVYNDYRMALDNMGLFIEEILALKFNSKLFKSVRVNFLFHLLTNVCLLGAIWKYLIVFKSLLFNFYYFALINENIF
jgi:hypothetical protein